MSNSTTNFEELFSEKLRNINGSQEGIQTLSLWIIHHRKQAKCIGKIWYKELKKLHRKRKLTFLYLMNDVVQNSRKKGSEFQKVFGAVLSHSIKDCAKVADMKMRTSLDRLIKVWRDRHVFDQPMLQQCDALLNKFAPGSASGSVHSKPKSSRSKSKPKKVSAAVGDDDEEASGTEDAVVGADSPGMRDAGVGSDDEADESFRIDSPNDDILNRSRNDDLLSSLKEKKVGQITTLKKELAAQMEVDRGDWPDADQIMSSLEFLLHTPSGNAEMRQRIARFPKHVVDESYVEKVHKKKDCKKMLAEVVEADLILVDYNQQLSSEIERRRSFHHQLRQFCTLQRNMIVISKDKLKEHRTRLQQVQSVREELSAHLARLPDLSTLPDVTGGNLAPLPSSRNLRHRIVLRSEDDSDESSDDDVQESPSLMSLVEAISARRERRTRQAAELDCSPRYSDCFSSSQFKHDVKRWILSHPDAQPTLFSQLAASSLSSNQSSSSSEVFNHSVSPPKLLRQSVPFSQRHMLHLSHLRLPNHGKEILRSESYFFCGIFSSPGDIFMCACQGDDSPIQVFDTRDGDMKLIKQVRARDVGWSVLDLSLSPTGHHMIYSSWSTCLQLVGIHSDMHLALELMPSGSNYRGYGRGLFCHRWSSDGESVVVGCSGGGVFVYNLNRQKAVFSVEHAHRKDVNTVSWVEDRSSQLLLSSGDDGIVKLWDLRCFSSSRVTSACDFSGHRSGVVYLDSKQDGMHFISNSKDQTIKVFDLRRPASRDFVHNCLKNVQENTFDYRYELIPEFEKTPMQGDPSLITLSGHVVSRTLLRAKFSPLHTTAQRYVYSGTANGELIIWDLLTGVILRRIRGLHGNAPVRDVSWHPYDFQRLHTSGWDAKINCVSFVPDDNDNIVSKIKA